jgi:formate dehydrogenase subunit beta
METVIPVKNGDVLAAIRGFLRQLVESGIVESLFVPLELENGMVAPALVVAADRLAQANPLLPIMPINNARAVTALTDKRTPSKLGAVLRPCEIRALIELVKLQQANLENVTLIAFDCPGTYEMVDYQVSLEGQNVQMSEYLRAASQGEAPDVPPYNQLPLRLACQMCVQPLPTQADIYLHLIGVDATQGIPVTFKDEDTRALLVKQLQLEEKDLLNDAVPKAVEKLILARKEVRERELTGIRSRMNANGGIASIFAACIRCHNCMTACPICYCKTCLFRSAAFDHPPEAYLKAAARKGAQRMLGDTLLFHMTRLNHMSASCVNCGMCSSACPVDIPVGIIFSAIGEQVQAERTTAFGNLPGR